MGGSRLGQDQVPAPARPCKRNRRRPRATLRGPRRHRAVTPSRPTPPGSANSRSPSPTTRPPTSSPPSTRLRRTWRRTIPMDRLISRRCRLRQNRGRRARRLQGRAGRQAGRRARAHDPAGDPAALETFTERFAGFPVQDCACSPASRRPTKPAKLPGGSGLRRDGRGRSVPTASSSDEYVFKDLGLVIIDEEQRFGVEHKEKLKADAHQRGRAGHERHPDPAHPGDVADRYSRDLDAGHRRPRTATPC